MKYEGVCIVVKDVTLSKTFYQELFGLEVFETSKRKDVSESDLEKLLQS